MVVLDVGQLLQQEELQVELPEVVQVETLLLLVGEMMVEPLQLLQMVQIIILLLVVVVLVLLEQMLLIKAPDKAGLVVMV